MEQKWIPGSERLPDDGDVRFYMCIVENHEEDLPMFCQYAEERGFGFWRDYYDADTLGFVDSEFQTNEELGYEKVVAWMPLPEPYRESEVDYAPMTNADRIRSMTDEELALAIMCPAEYDLNFNKNEKCNGEMSENCYECSLKWLQAESEGK